MEKHFFRKPNQNNLNMEAHEIKQRIGQIEKTIDDIAPFIDEEKFEDYCNDAYKLISKWKQLIKYL